MPTPEEISESLSHIGMLVSAVAKHAADIAHARRALYDAHIAEGFTEEQAFEYAKIVTLHQ
ncbi:MAG: hypothetical protein ACKVOB_13520 [Sphingomonas sp.]